MRVRRASRIDNGLQREGRRYPWAPVRVGCHSSGRWARHRHQLPRNARSLQHHRRGLRSAPHREQLRRRTDAPREILFFCNTYSPTSRRVSRVPIHVDVFSWYEFSYPGTLSLKNRVYSAACLRPSISAAVIAHGFVGSRVPTLASHSCEHPGAPCSGQNPPSAEENILLAGIRLTHQPVEFFRRGRLTDIAENGTWW